MLQCCLRTSVMRATLGVTKYWWPWLRELPDCIASISLFRASFLSFAFPASNQPAILTLMSTVLDANWCFAGFLIPPMLFSSPRFGAAEQFPSLPSAWFRSSSKPKLSACHASFAHSFPGLLTHDIVAYDGWDAVAVKLEPHRTVMNAGGPNDYEAQLRCSRHYARNEALMEKWKIDTGELF